MIDERRLHEVKSGLASQLQDAALFDNGGSYQFYAGDFANMLDELIVMRIKQALEAAQEVKE